MATQSPMPAQEHQKLRKGQRAPSVMSRRSSSIFGGKETRDKGYWNELMCMLSGLSADPTKIVGVTSLNNTDYFNDQPSPPRSPLLRARSSRNSFASSVRPTFAPRLSSRSLLRRVRSGRISAASLENEPKADATAQGSATACEPLMEVDESSPTSFDDILNTVPASQQSDVMVTVQSGGRTLWLPQRVIQQYAAISTEPAESTAPRSAKPDMKLQIPSRSSSKNVVHQSDSEGQGQTLTLVDSYSTTSSSPGSQRSKDSFSTSSMRTPSLDSPSSAYSSGGSSLSSLEIHTPVDGASIETRHKKSASVDSAMSGIFDGALNLVPPPIKPRNPRRAMVENGIEQKDFGLLPAPAQSPDDLEQRISAFNPPTDSPPVPQRSERRAAARPAPAEAAPKKLATRKSFGDMSLAVVSDSEEARVNADAAEAVIFNIYLAVTSLPDLFSLARVNNGFYAVYKRYELILIKTALRNHSAAAWELGEISDEDAASQGSPEHATPLAFLQRLQHDTQALAALKAAILDRCQSFLRPSTIDALRGTDLHSEAAIDDALWRIWSFCLIFGSGQDREAELDAQADWLRGGPAARQTAQRLGSASVFGQGNGPDGLSAAQLYDMTELWNCITGLVAGIVHAPGAVERARAHGILAPGAAPALLEDWLAYQLTHGLSVALDLAAVAADPAADVFAFAADAGLAAWRPLPAAPAFLRDALSRVYAERLDESDVHPALRRGRAAAAADDDRDASPAGFVTPRETSARPASSHYASATSSSYSSPRSSRAPSPAREAPASALSAVLAAVSSGPWS